MTSSIPLINNITDADNEYIPNVYQAVTRIGMIERYTTMRRISRFRNIPLRDGYTEAMTHIEKKWENPEMYNNPVWIDYGERWDAMFGKHIDLFLDDFLVKYTSDTSILTLDKYGSHKYEIITDKTVLSSHSMVNIKNTSCVSPLLSQSYVSQASVTPRVPSKQASLKRSREQLQE
jgi:hypothetical protein